MEEKNMVEVVKIGECLLNEILEIEKYQDELKNKMLDCNKKLEEVEVKIEDNDNATKLLKAKDEQLLELVKELGNNDEAKGVLKSKREKILADTFKAKEELKKLENEVANIEKEFESFNKLNVNIEYGKNMLLAFGTKYGFLVKKEKENVEIEGEKGGA